jgi:glycerol-1-phosphate dehydrogenase [NAD(P)+]
MSSERTTAALELAGDTKRVTTGSGVLSRVDEVFAGTFGDAAAIVVADGNTWAAAGWQVHEHLEAAGRPLREPYVFPGEPTLYAEDGAIETLVGALRAHEAIPVAVGSGTLNDIVKRAAFETDRPYMVVGTAASMDGYTSFGAAITKDGYKQTLSCPAPRAVLADLEVLTRAPAEMTQRATPISWPRSRPARTGSWPTRWKSSPSTTACGTSSRARSGRPREAPRSSRPAIRGRWTT